ncbi:MAG: Zn-dependent hydrolase [Magnetococcales bacterium]|nr:Zn-dependent hydrolase [Magnetococcales bacterium]
MLPYFNSNLFFLSRFLLFKHRLVSAIAICTVITAVGNEGFAATVEEQLDQFVTVKTAVDLSKLSEKQRLMLPLLEDAARAMDGIFWQQAYGDKEELFSRWPGFESRQLLKIHYGPWDRYRGNAPLFADIPDKQPGANFYPSDITPEELSQSAKKNPALINPYSMVRRNAKGELVSIPYHRFFANEHQEAAKKLKQAAHLAEDPGFKSYLSLRAEALLSDNYQPSDFAWMAMKNNSLDIIIGPIEIYEDGLGYKAAHEAFVLLKDSFWSHQLEKYAKLLPDWQQQLPVPPAYKQDSPGAESDLGVYDLILSTGDAAATRPIAMHLPNDVDVQLAVGSRRLQLKNAMQAKFDHILLPLAKLIIHPEQRQHVRMEHFFANTVYHEIAHGLGVKKLLGSGAKVETALRENSWMLEEGKADAVGMFIAAKLRHAEQWSQSKWLDSQLTSFTSIFRSIRFGTTSSHARANLIRFNYLKDNKAFDRTVDGLYRINPEQMESATSSLINIILRLQGDGDYDGLLKLEKRYGVVGPELEDDLKRIKTAKIPVDVIFSQ